MERYLSGRRKELNIGISSYTENNTALTVIGNVGIGTTNPTSKLTVQGDVKVSDTTATSILNVGTGGTIITTTSIGLVGIGTTNPTQSLDVNGSVRFRSRIYDINNSPGSNNNVLTSNGSSGWSWQPLSAVGNANIAIDTDTADTSRYLVFTKISSGSTATEYVSTTGLVFNPSSSSLGIGTTNPTQSLDVNGSVRFRSRIYDINNSPGSNNNVLTSNGSSGWSWQPLSAVGNANIAIDTDTADTSRYLVFTKISSGSTATEYVSTTGLVFNPSSSSLGIGTTNPTSKLTVQGDGKFTGVVTATTFIGNLTGYASSSGIATNLQGGAGGSIPYQFSAGITSFLSNGNFGQLLQSNGGTSAPSWTTASLIYVGYAATAGIATYAISAGYASTAGIATYAISAGYASTAGIATYSTSSGYASTAGISTYATSSGYASTAGIATVATNINSGTIYQIPYQSAPNTTAFISTTSAVQGYLLQYNTSSAPSWTSPQGLIIGYANTAGIATYATNAGIATYATNAGIATNIKGGVGGSIPYQSNTDTTSLLANGSAGNLLQSNGGTNAPSWASPQGLTIGYANTAGIATYATTAGIATNVIGGIGSLSTLQVTGISTFTNGPVLIGSGTSTGTANQRLQVTGGAYVSGSVGIGTTNPLYTLSVTGSNASVTPSLTNVLSDFTANTNSFSQINTRNASNGTSASSDFVATADTGTDTTNFIDLGINNSGYSVGTWTINGALDGYLYTSDTNLSIGAAGANKYVSIFTGGTLAANERLRVTGTGSVGIGTTNPSQTLHVQGNARVTGAVYDSTNSPGTSGQVLQSTVSGTTWVTATVPAVSGTKFDTTIDNVLYIQPTGTLDIVGVGTTTSQITTLPAGSNKYIVHSIHVTNISNGDAEVTAGFVMNAKKVPASISVSVGSSGGPGIHTFTVGSASSITVGMAVTGTGNIGETTGIGTTAGFQFNTYVTSVDGNNITLSKPMSGYATGILYFSPVSKTSSRLPFPVGSAVELLKQPMVLNALDSIVIQSTGAGSGIGSTSTAAISQTINSNTLTVTAGAAITSFITSGMLIQPTGSNTGIQTNTFVGVGYIPGSLSVPMTRPATVSLASTSLSFTEIVVPEDGAIQATIVYQSSTDTSYLNGTGTVVAISSNTTSTTAGLSSTPVAYYGTGLTYPSILQSIKVSNISDGMIYPGGDYPVWVGIGNSDTIFSWLAYNMIIPKNSSIELCEAPKRLGIGQSIFAYSNTPYAIEIQIAGKQKTS
jgi:hypothetical protein